jgi:exodeoxyribonuclease VII large subunit
LNAKIPTRSRGEGSLFIANFEAATGQRFTNDLNVLVQVSVFYHPVYGLQLTLLNIDTSFALGALEKQKQATLRRLVAENPQFIRLEKDTYITFNQELSLPLTIQHIAVISSSASAGMEDFLHTLQTNISQYQFKVDPYYSVVQGEMNAHSIVDQLIAIYNSAKPYDAVVLTWRRFTNGPVIVRTIRHRPGNRQVSYSRYYRHRSSKKRNRCRPDGAYRGQNAHQGRRIYHRAH